MKLIAHRRNTIAELLATDPKYGIEIDIRSQGERLIIHHDPFVEGNSFDEWIKVYQHGTLILNVKEEVGCLSQLVAAHRVVRGGHYTSLLLQLTEGAL